jgi:hypothetical protein
MAITIKERWVIDCDNNLTITGIKRSNGTYVNSGTVVGVLKDRDGNTVTGAETVTFSYTSNSDGVWTSNLPSTLTLVENKIYDLFVTIDDGSNDVVFIESRIAKYLEI